MKEKKLKILFSAAELAPIAKAGGLGDVIGALPKNLIKLGCQIKIILPFYGFIDKKKYPIKKIGVIKIATGNGGERASLWQTFIPKTKIPVILIGHKIFSGQSIYGSERIQLKGKYTRALNDIEKFSFFSHATLEAIKKINWQPDIIHCHDWHTASIPDYLKTIYKNDKFFKNTKTIYTIHNLANQGIALPEIIGFSKLNPDLPIIKADLKNGDINFMVQGILGADLVTTVSPTYAKEILTHYEGAGLDNILQKRKKDLYGILNGIDTDFFNPAKDNLIKKKYSAASLDKKMANKLALQKRLGLPQDKNIALIGFISRFVWQKGIELITPEFSKLNCQFVFLGAGQPKYENHLKNLAKKYPKTFNAQIAFDEKLAHLIYAGADIFLVPSRFEPCGLTQMIAMRYGAVPIVRATGGLADTVNNKVGFKFKNFNSGALYKELEKALNLFYNKPAEWKKLQINGMKKDFSWDKSAKEYLKLYKKVLLK
jgi:starch synthase